MSLILRLQFSKKASGNHCIAIFKESEGYGVCLTDTTRQVKELESGITVREQIFDIEFYLGGDWKFYPW